MGKRFRASPPPIANTVPGVNQGELEQDEEGEEGEKDFHGFASILAIKARAVADAERMSATC